MNDDFEDGVIAAMEGQDESEIPHPMWSEKYDDWRDGWRSMVAGSSPEYVCMKAQPEDSQ